MLANQPEDQGRILAEIERRLRTLEGSSPLTSASIQDGALRVVDAGLVEHVKIGKQADGTYGINIDGGPVRALDIDQAQITVNNASLTTSEQFFAESVLTVPSWAVTAEVFGWLVFQMTNSSGGVQPMQFRTEIDGDPGFGAWTHDAPSGVIANTTDMTIRTLTGLGSTITVRAMCKVGTGVNVANIIRTRAVAFFFR